MLKLRQPVVVEGRYDRIRLASLIDGVILETGGFRIFSDRELLEGLRALARTTGLIILTDSDGAGFRIRSFLKNALGPSARLTQVYIPACEGVERRKSSSSAEGLLGVEGMDQATLLEAFHRAGVCCEEVRPGAGLTRADLYDAGLTGHPDSATRRRALLCRLSLPPRLSIATLLPLVNTLLTREEFWNLVREIFPS
ncbi:MAG: DUF4093 domain-containing protein [Oscillospiraceae bacterium]